MLMAVCGVLAEGEGCIGKDTGNQRFINFHFSLLGCDHDEGGGG